MQPVNIFWFRRDLRLQDNAGLYHALKGDLPVMPIFIFDRNILDKLENKQDRRVEFIHQAVLNMQEELVQQGSTLQVYYGYPADVFKELLSKHKIITVYTNEDYEPYAKERDDSIAQMLLKQGVQMKLFKDHVIFEKDEVTKSDGKPYLVFTPYSRQWKTRLNDFYQQAYPVEKYSGNFFMQPAKCIPSLSSMGFTAVNEPFPAVIPDEELISDYDKERDYPARSTSRMGIHLRFGTISTRELVRMAVKLNATYLNELIWREFYQMILWHFPHVGEGRAFKKEYEHIRWRNNEEEFERWCNGTTGYPIVDAGMRQLNETGFMHNRVRMITGSFLAKHLLIDWRWGEAYFADKLLDFDFAANNGNWQWVAGCGCDASPYFRIFNPAIQTKKFDPKLEYIKKWVPEFQEFNYPKPIVEHELARKRCLEVYGKALK